MTHGRNFPRISFGGYVLPTFDPTRPILPFTAWGALPKTRPIWPPTYILEDREDSFLRIRRSLRGVLDSCWRVLSVLRGLLARRLERRKRNCPLCCFDSVDVEASKPQFSTRF